MTSATDHVKQKLFDSDIKNRIANSIQQWTSSLPENLFVYPSAIFPEELDKNQTERPFLFLIQSKLENLIAPTVFEWKDALKEHWEIRKLSLGDTGQDFFRANWEDVDSHLSNLASKIATVCYTDTEFFRNTVLRIQNTELTISQPLNIEEPIPQTGLQKDWVPLEVIYFPIPTPITEKFKLSFCRTLLGSFYTFFQDKRYKKVTASIRAVTNTPYESACYEIISNQRDFLSFLRTSFLSGIRNDDFTYTRNFEIQSIDLIDQGWTVSFEIDIQYFPTSIEFLIDTEISHLSISSTPYNEKIDLSSPNNTSQQINLMCRIAEKSHLSPFLFTSLDFLSLSESNLYFISDFLERRRIDFSKIRIDRSNIEEWKYLDQLK